MTLPPSPKAATSSDDPRRGNHRSAQLAAIAALLLFGVAITAVLLQNHSHAQVVDPGDWEAAAEHIRAAYQPGDIIRIVPIWADEPRVFLHGLEIDMNREPDPEVLDTYERIWLLVGLGRVAEAKASLPQSYILEEERNFGGADTLRFRLPASARPHYDFLAHIQESEASRFRDDQPLHRCTNWTHQSWHCDRYDRWLNVGIQMRDMDADPRTCIYFPAMPDHYWHQLTFRDVQMHSEIRGRVGHDNWAVRSERGSEVSFEVRINGELAYARVLAPRDPLFHRYTIDTTPWQGESVDVQFRVYAADFFDRFLCFTAQIPQDPSSL